MFLAIVVSLSVSFLAISLLTVAISWHAGRIDGQMELVTLGGFLLSSAPHFFMAIKTLVVLFVPDFPWDLIYFFYAITVMLAYAGFSTYAHAMFKIAEKIAGGFNYWKQWVVILVFYFFIFSPIIVLNIHPIIFTDGGLIYKTVACEDLPFGLGVMAITVVVFLPFFYKFSYLNMKNKSRIGKINGTLILAFLGLLGLSVFYAAIFGNTEGAIVVGFILQNVCALILLILFSHPHAIEAIIMQLNIEAVYISTIDGEVLLSAVFIPGRLSQGNDELIGNMMRGTDQAMMQILESSNVGLQRLILDDDTILITEPSKNRELVYILHMRSYSSYTRSRVKRMCDVLDERLAHVNSINRSSVNAEITKKAIMDVFL